MGLHVIFTSSHIIIVLQVVIETYTELSSQQEDTDIFLSYQLWYSSILW